MKALFLVLLLLLPALLHAEEPSVKLYQVIEEDMERGEMPELILTVSNPTDRLFYVYGLGITAIPHNIEVLRNGRWEVVPPRRCGFGMSQRKFLPRSSIVFTALEAPLHEDDITFRVRVYLYTEPDIYNIYTQPDRKPVELVSPEFSTKDFHKKRATQFKSSRLPGTDLDKTLETPLPAAPKIPGLEPIPQ